MLILFDNGTPRGLARWAKDLPPNTPLTLDRPHVSNIFGDIGRTQEVAVQGNVVWIYGKGLGRYLFTASARPGFHKSAVADGALLRFGDAPDSHTANDYTVGLHSSAVAIPGAWFIWVKHEPKFRPPAMVKTGALAIGTEK